MRAAANGYLAVGKALPAAGAIPDIDFDGQAVLMRAAANGHSATPRVTARGGPGSAHRR